MSDKVPLGLDVDSLTEALDHLHLATDSLSRALSSAEPCPSEEWIVVQDDALRESPPAPLRALIPNPPLVLVTLLLGLGLGPLTLAPLGFLTAEDCMQLVVCFLPSRPGSPCLLRRSVGRPGFVRGKSLP